MHRLENISNIAARFGVSTRALRYYEEVGLLWSVRPDPAQPRLYTPEAIRRLEQILALRKVQTPLREIQQLFTLQDPTVALDAFVDRLAALNREARDLQTRREILERLLALFRREQQARSLEGPSLPEEIVALAQQAAAPLPPKEAVPLTTAITYGPDDIRIVSLPPMRMARYHDPVAPSCFDSWRHMIAWARGHRLPVSRAFGHTSPNPEGIIPKYGYDVLLSIPDGFEPKGHIHSEEFPGGLYAVVTTTYSAYVGHWRALGHWVRSHAEYEAWSGPGLEELHAFDYSVGRDAMVDLLYPIQHRATLPPQG